MIERLKSFPFTSKKPKDLDVNSSIFKLSDESIKSICDLAKKETYTLCDIIQTVCVTRILPPLFKLKGYKQYYRNENYRLSIYRNDKRLLDKGLALSISKIKIYLELEELKINTKTRDSEIYKLKNSSFTLKERYMYTSEINALHIDEIDEDVLL
ncbi:hypothetical protein [Proteus hauseri]|uniref:hypothetical protein n=1 Tax=Proteus hauseri TaxID=183417 RepID=UPI0010097E05|nr:hypothetical protein [Proteus hauseri]QAV23641.1 hypothetical protein PH4a_09975 [Proteus hauseri]